MRRRQEESEEDKFSSVPEPLRSLLNGTWSWWDAFRAGFKESALQFIQQNSSVILIAVFSLVKATGVTVKSGHTGLLFSFGRAKREIPPGFRLLIPFLQIVRTLPTRQRTLDLPAQRVTTLDGLVYLVDANIVFRVVDVRKALIEIDDLLKGMRQVLVLSVQEVLRNTERDSLRVPEKMDKALEDAMAILLEPWGVELINAGFTSITPSPATLQLVQLDVRVNTRARSLDQLNLHVPEGLALPLLGTPQRIITRSQVLAEREIVRRRHRRVRRVLRTELKRSGLKISSKEHARLRRKIRIEAGMSGVLNG